MGLTYCWPSFCKSFDIPYPEWLKTLNYVISHDRHISSGNPKVIWNKPQGTKYSELNNGKGPFLFLLSFWWTWSAFLMSVLLDQNKQVSQNICGSSVRASAILQALTKSRYILMSIFSQESNNWLSFTTFPPPPKFLLLQSINMLNSLSYVPL